MKVTDVTSHMKRCEVVAEIGTNHQGSLDIALKMIDMCCDAGVDAVKFQKRDNRTLYTKSFYDSPYNSENAFGSTYGEHREALEFDEHGFQAVARAARAKGLRFYCTAFDEPSVDFLVDRVVDAIKIASGSLKDVPLLNKVRDTGLPVYLSTGGGTLVDINRALLALGKTHPKLLQCTASYPCKPEELDLGVITKYRQMWPYLEIGASLHDNGIWSAVAAYVLGARTIEKHVTLDRTMRGTDQAFSLEPQGLRKLVRDLRRAETALGTEKRVHDSEIAPILKMSRSWFAARPSQAGTILGDGDVNLRSPGTSFPAHMSPVGQQLLRDLNEEDPLMEDDLVSHAGVLRTEERGTPALGV